jgi:hypothetical protein
MTNRHSQSRTALLRTSVTVMTLLMAFGGLPLAQAQAPAPQAEPAPAAFSALRVEIVLSRLDAKGSPVTRTPYLFSLSTPAGSNCRLRMGAEVPVPQGGPDGTVSYRGIGTNIDCSVRQVAPDGRFQIGITIEESSVFGNDMIEPSAAAKFGNMPIFRSYQSINSVVLRSGESARFTAAADRVTGETVTAEVTLTVLK